MTELADDSSFIGRGWPFPVRPDPVAGRLLWSAHEEKVRQSMWLILATAPGERVMRPDFGCGVNELVFQPNTVAFHGVVAERVRTALVRWEPRVDVLGVDITAPEDVGSVLLVHVDYRIRANNAAGNLVYPYYLTEGPGGAA